MIEIDGSQYSGSGTIVRQAVVLSALTGQAVHIVNARAGRPKPGLRPQHIRVVEAIRELSNGTAEGLSLSSRELIFRPGSLKGGRRYHWDIGSAGSTTNLALAILPVAAFGSDSIQVELRGGLFQDFAPSFYHLQHVVLPLLRQMGLEAEVEMGRPGYVPRGEGILILNVKPVRYVLRSMVLEHGETVHRLWGIALASHLEERRVSHRMADSAKEIFRGAGYQADIEVRYDTTARQPGAALAAFVDIGAKARLGADRAGAPRRSSEAIGRYVAHHLLDDLKTGATLDRHAADQIIPFAALAEGESRFRIPRVTDHILTNAWLVQTFLGAQATVQEQGLAVTGMCFQRSQV